MKYRALITAILTLAILGPGGHWCPAQSLSNGIAAVVNGTVITLSEVRESVKAQEQIYLMEFRNDPMALNKAMEELKERAVDSLIDRELILAEFRKIGGTIRPQYIDDEIDNIVRENFGGDRTAFVTELARAGMTLKKFREEREKMLIVQIMRGRYTADEGPPTPLEVREY